MGPVTWIIVLGILLIVPFWRLFPRYGIPKYAAILCFFPLVAIGALWLIAFKPEEGEGDPQ